MKSYAVPATGCILSLVIFYIIMASVCCKSMSALFYPIMSSIYGHENVLIASCDVDGNDYGHAYLMINGKPYEPRFFGTMLLNHIDYLNPISTWNNVQSFRQSYILIPFVSKE